MNQTEKLALLFVEHMPITEDEWIDIFKESDKYFSSVLINRYRKDVYRIAYTHEQTLGCPKIDEFLSAVNAKEFLSYLDKCCRDICFSEAISGIPRMGWYYDNIEPEFLAKFIAYFYK